jgi:L-alanine-DL-glutamate epimerase-like enolase superfamily enzyme
MKIESVQLHPVVVERRYGTVIAREGGKPKRTVTRSYFYLVAVKTDTGLIGWGEVSDMEPDEIPGNASAYAETLTGFLAGRDPFAIQKIHQDFREHFEVSKGSLARYTVCALDMALYDLQGQVCKRPIHDLLGGAVRIEVPISWVAFIREDLDALRAEIRQKVAQGFSAFKLKVGVDIDLDEKRLAVLREVAGKEASIKVDANEGWSVAEAPRNIRRLNRFHLAGVETPVPRENPADIAAVRRQVKVPIIEHVNDPGYALALIKANAVDVMNIATTGAGGLWPARAVATLARAAGMGVLLGSTVELGPGTLAQLHLAATIPNLTLPSDLVGPGLYRNDVLVQPLTYHKGKLAIPQTPGLGGAIDQAKVRKLAFGR